MIINHSKKFIFFANKKTASTSIAISLSSSCNKADVITPLGRDEAIRRELGYTSPRNFIPWWNYPQYRYLLLKQKFTQRSVLSSIKKIGLHTHISAEEALENGYISRSMLDNYFTFCFIRNPWEHTASIFHWIKRKTTHEALTLDEFIHCGRLERWAHSCRRIYTINGHMCMSRMCKYENAQEEVELIFRELSLSGNPQLPMAKSHIRKDRRSYQDILSQQQAREISRIFEYEIELGSYQF